MIYRKKNFCFKLVTKCGFFSTTSQQTNYMASQIIGGQDHFLFKYKLIILLINWNYQYLCGYIQSSMFFFQSNTLSQPQKAKRSHEYLLQKLMAMKNMRQTKSLIDDYGVENWNIQYIEVAMKFASISRSRQQTQLMCNTRYKNFTDDILINQCP